MSQLNQPTAADPDERSHMGDEHEIEILRMEDLGRRDLMTAQETQPRPGMGKALPAGAEDAISLVVAGVLSGHSRRAYVGDIRFFLDYLAQRDIALSEITRPVLVQYRAHLALAYAPSTVNRRLTVARRLVTEAWELGLLREQGRNPAQGHALSGLKDAGERGKPALTLEQARTLLEKTRSVGDLPAIRDTAILHLLIGTGLRRSELAAARLSDLSSQGPHTVLAVTGKGNKRRVAKLSPAVCFDLSCWLSEISRGYVNKSGRFQAVQQYAPLFSPIKRTGRGKEAVWVAEDRALSGWGVWQVVTRRIKEAGLDVDTTPHGLRATFITLALEAGASLSKVQDAAGHKDPRTTDMYRRRKANLDDNAADYIDL